MIANDESRIERCNLGGEIVFVQDMGMVEHVGENGKLVRYRVGRVVSEAEATDERS